MKKINNLVDTLELKPHPEGGYYKEVYRAKDKVQVLEEKYGDKYRSSSTSIYFLMTSDMFSAWHRIKSDEIWNYHEGSSITIMSINPAGELHSQLLGSKLSDPTALYQVIVPAGDWFCAHVNDKSTYSLVGCSVSPAFEFSDFELADRATLSAQFKQHASIIEKFTRESDLIKGKEQKVSTNTALKSAVKFQFATKKIVFGQEKIVTVQGDEHEQGKETTAIVNKF